MRKTMTKEVTTTTVKVAKIEVVNGQPNVVNLPDEILIGNVDAEKAQKAITKKMGVGVQVISVEPDTKVYEMLVSDFIQVATLRVPSHEESGEVIELPAPEEN